MVYGLVVGRDSIYYLINMLFILIFLSCIIIITLKSANNYILNVKIYLRNNKSIIV